jgi:hypothetical protein
VLAAARAEALSVRLDQPAPKSVLQGGSTSTIAWSAADLHGDIEEWEAFLSVDGGRYYAARITPHLDIAIRSFAWTVPNIQTDNARILLRFGNERDERIVELPLTISIRASAERARIDTTAAESGEAARPGDPAVETWVEGDRDGDGIRVVHSRHDHVDATRGALPDHDRSSLTPPTFVLRASPRSSEVLTVRRGAAGPPRVAIASDALLRTCRLNI